MKGKSSGGGVSRSKPKRMTSARSPALEMIRALMRRAVVKGSIRLRGGSEGTGH